ncbi:anthranilate synthase component I family protein [Leucobacter sp. HY1908]
MQKSVARGTRRIIPGQFDAEALARALAATGEAWCWLDGAAPAPGEPGVSYFGVTDHVMNAQPGREREFLTRLGEARSRAATGGEGAFHSGWVAALGYEMGVALMGITPAIDDAPPAFALRLDVVLALTGSSVELRADTAEAIDDWLARHEGTLERAARGERDTARGAAPGPAQAAARWRRSGADYAAQVTACQRSIAAGDAYVLCLTDTATSEGRFDPVDIYARLRATGTATRGGVIVAGDRALVSASPERFLSVRGRCVATHPIKGTRPRGHDALSDRVLAAELAHDPKERAENLMIVDLMRNDLSRVCDAGSVGVRAFLQVEEHPHVHQLVSSVEGRLATGRSAVDAVEACFPGGSMTGAPKRRAVELLAVLEAGPRGLYSGCFGWFDDGGDAELAMTIRGVELRGLLAPRQRALVGAGGGVTADSDAESERAEKDLKAASILAALA